MSDVRQKLIESKLKAIDKLYHKIHVETNKEYHKYDECKAKIYKEIEELETQILKLGGRQ